MMKTTHYQLLPFDQSPSATGIQIGVQVALNPQGLSVHYDLEGPLDRLRMPGAVHPPARKDDLWQTTCFECFIRKKDADIYREFNFSPNGNWNAYRFTGYRQAMTPDPSVTDMATIIRKEPDRLVLTVIVDLASLDLAGFGLQLALSAVTQTKNGRLDYWALCHPDAKPDFHHPSSFVVSLVPAVRGNERNQKKSSF